MTTTIYLQSLAKVATELVIVAPIAHAYYGQHRKIQPLNYLQILLEK